MRSAALAVSFSLLAGACGPGDDRARPTPPAAGSVLPPSTPSAGPADPSPASSPDPARARVRLVRVVSVRQPLAMATRAGDSSLYIAQKTGEVVAVRRGRVARRLLVDLSAEVSRGGEQGLLGLVFSPDGSFLYVNITDLEGDTRVLEFRMRGARVVEGSRREVLSVDQPYSNHNGGHLVFGPDGYLYIGLGDGGSGGDPQDNAQDLGSLLGKMLRIDPRPKGRRSYGVPADNPFVGRADVRPEIWAYGLRNPWRYSFDRSTGELWIADVGQSDREEIDLQPDPRGGHNYGWDGFEGTLVHEEPVPQDAVEPVHEYGREKGATVIGGYVYRGSSIPELHGAYIFGDFFDPILRALVPAARGFREIPLRVRVPDLSAFGEDAKGELYATSLSGQVYRLSPADAD